MNNLILTKKILHWYDNNKRILPWRKKCSQKKREYFTLVSEFMLQQTQVSRVHPRYETWLKRWPTAESLAEATTGTVIREWAGLGYNRRAVNLQRAAREALEKFGGIPTEEAKLLTLPGVGPYTAAAVACFAGDKRTVALDTNIARVVARTLLGEDVPWPPWTRLRQSACGRAAAS